MRIYNRAKDTSLCCCRNTVDVFVGSWTHQLPTFEWLKLALIRRDECNAWKCVKLEDPGTKRYKFPQLFNDFSLSLTKAMLLSLF